MDFLPLFPYRIASRANGLGSTAGDNNGKAGAGATGGLKATGAGTTGGLKFQLIRVILIMFT
jgi:hypothetical protein